MFQTLEITRRNPFNGAIYDKGFLNATSMIRIMDIKGLGPVKAEVFRAPSATQPGGMILSNRIGERNIVLTLEMSTDWIDDWTLTDVRRNLSNLLNPGSTVELRFTNNENEVVEIEGVVETSDPEMFVEHPVTTVSIICAHPYFKKVNGLTKVTFSSTTPSPWTVNYVGRNLAPVGFKFQSTLTAGGASSAIGPPALSQDGGLRGYLSIVGYPLVAGDIVKFNTIRGQRSVGIERSFADYNALGFFNGSLSDFQILPGMNYIRWNRGAGYDHKLEYTPEYVSI